MAVNFKVSVGFYSCLVYNTLKKFSEFRACSSEMPFLNSHIVADP